MLFKAVSGLVLIGGLTLLVVPSLSGLNFPLGVPAEAPNLDSVERRFNDADARARLMSFLAVGTTQEQDLGGDAGSSSGDSSSSSSSSGGGSRSDGASHSAAVPDVSVPLSTSSSLEPSAASVAGSPSGLRAASVEDGRSNLSAAIGAEKESGSDSSDAIPRNISCSTVFLSTYFTSKKDPQRFTYMKQTYAYIDAFRTSILSTPGARAVILHDGLKTNFTENATDPDLRFSFKKVDLNSYDSNLGTNDVRFFAYAEEIQSHPEWDNVFLTDVSDVVVLHNPCALVDKTPGKLFVGSEPFTLKDHGYMENRFKEMDGKYLKWFRKDVRPDVKILNAGIVGGRSGLVLNFIEKMKSVISDPNLKARKDKKEVKVNMAALNWVISTAFNHTDIYTGGQLHTVFKKYEHNRTDVYLRHKI